MSYDNTIALLKANIPALGALAQTNDGAEELLHAMAISATFPPESRYNDLNNFFAEHGDTVFPTSIGDDDVLLCKIRFNEPWSFTIQYDLSDNSYCAVGIEFAYSGLRVDAPVDIKPWRVLVSERTVAIPENIQAAGLNAVYRFAGQFYDGDSDIPAKVPDQPLTTRAMFPDGYFVPSLSEPRLPLKDMSLEHTAFEVIKSMVKQYSEITHDHIFGRPFLSECDIVTPRFKLQSSYSGTEDNWNFIWRDVNIQWYKHAGRCLVINRPLLPRELGEMMDEVTEVLRSYPFKKTPQNYKEPLTPDQIEIITRRLEQNAMYGSFGTYPPSALKD